MQPVPSSTTNAQGMPEVMNKVWAGDSVAPRGSVADCDFVLGMGTAGHVVGSGHRHQLQLAIPGETGYRERGSLKSQSMCALSLVMKCYAVLLQYASKTKHTAADASILISVAPPY